ncbi:MAG: glycosyltransferase family 39 protein, partial [Caldilineaceae bacterium]|nr:glycosyltransferase family 39 protein [Caldilineaceae bacterium]
MAPALVLLAAFALSLAGITQESIWMDESWSLWAVRDGWLNLWQRVADDAHPPLYFLLLHGWTLAVGETPFAARYLSAGSGLLALAITYALAQRLFDRATALVALLWLGSSGLWVYYTRETRMYTLVIALAALSLWSYAHWLARPRSWRALLVLALTNGMLLYAHYAAFFLISAQVAHLLLTQPRQLFRFLQGAML